MDRDSYFNCWFFKIRKSSVVIGLLGGAGFDLLELGGDYVFFDGEYNVIN